jgi:hypothetical protein
LNWLKADIKHVFFTDIATGIPITADFTKMHVQLFPNPAEEVLNVRFYSIDKGNIILSIIDLQGRTVMQQEHLMEYIGTQTIQLKLLDFPQKPSFHLL